MIQNKKNIKRNFLLFVSIILLFLMMTSSMVLAVETSNDLKITMTKMDTSNGIQRNMNFQPISLDVIDDIASLDHVDEVIPAANMVYRNFPNDGTFPDRDSMPEPNDMLSDFPGSFPGGERMNRMADYIVEGVQITDIKSYLSSILSIELESGVYPSENDSYWMIIGKSAQEYFDSGLSETITIEETEFTVIGIFNNETYNNFVFMSISNAQSLYGLDSNEINTIYIYADDASSVETLYNALIEEYPEYQIRSVEYSTFDFPFKEPNNKDGQTDSYTESIDVSTPGFEVISLLFIVCIFIIMKQLRKGDKN